MRHARQELGLVLRGKSQLVALLLKQLHELDLVDGHGGLTGEGRADGHLALVERTYVAAPDVQHPHDVIVAQHGCRHGCAEAGDSLEIEPTEVRVGEHVGDLTRGAFETHPPAEASPVENQRMVGHVRKCIVGDADCAGQPVDIVLEEVQERRVGPAQSASAVQDRVQYLVGIAREAAQGRQHLVRGGELTFERQVVALKSDKSFCADNLRACRFFDHGCLPRR